MNKIKELRVKYNLTQKEFAEYFGIPFRTVQNWEYEKTECADYLFQLLKDKLQSDNEPTISFDSTRKEGRKVKQKCEDNYEYCEGELQKGIEDIQKQVEMLLSDKTPMIIFAALNKTLEILNAKGKPVFEEDYYPDEKYYLHHCYYNEDGDEGLDYPGGFFCHLEEWT